MWLSPADFLQGYALYFLFPALITSHPLVGNNSFIERVDVPIPRVAIDARAPTFYARILPLGASIVFGVGSSDRNGFRKPLRDALRQAGWKVNMVGSKANGDMRDNSVEARSGNRVDQIRAAAASSFQYQPNIVLINAGTNDCDQGFDLANIGKRMDALLDDLFTNIPDTTIIVSTVIASTKGTIASTRRQVNYQYRSLVHRRRWRLKQKIVLADMDTPGTTFLTTSDLVPDGIHPNDGGHKKMASIFLRAINEAYEAGFISPPRDAPAVQDDGATSNTCNKVYGVSRGPIDTQAGSGLDDGVYKHNSASKGVTMTAARNASTSWWFANPRWNNYIAPSELIEYGQADANKGGRWYTQYRSIGPGQWDLSNGKRFWLADGCIARGVRWADLSDGGLDDFLCISPNGDVYASLNPYGPIDNVWKGPALWKSNEGFAQDRIRIADIDGDGRADYCVVADNGDISCWRNGGQGRMPEYWQALGVVITGKGMGDVSGVSLYDINGDFRDDWLWMNDKGETWTYTNNRGCTKGRLGQGLTPLWRAGENAVDGVGHTHAGLGIAGVRDQIHFARANFSAPVFALRSRADYIRIEPVAGTGTKVTYRFHVWQNTGGGGTKLKADGDRYCNMMGHLNGAQDYVWVHSTGYMRIYESMGGSFPGDPPYWGPNYIIWDPSSLLGRSVDRRHLHLADWNGDGLCDIIHVEPTTGFMQVWINKFAQNRDFSQWDHWVQGTQFPPPNPPCSGMIGKGLLDIGTRFADIDGNGLADLLCVEPDGRTWGYLNSNGGKTLTYVSQIKKSEGKDRANLHFADVNGDGRADLLWSDKFNGDAQVWYNRGPTPSSGSAFTWDSQGTLYQGAAQGNCIMFPDLDGNGRADMHVVDSVANTAETWFNDCGNGGGDDANTLTIAPVQPGPAVSSDVVAFLAAFHGSGYDGDDISDDDMVALATMLVGFQGCDEGDKEAVYSGWVQSWKLMNFIKPKVKNIDWNAAAAVEYLGPPAVISAYFERIKEIIGNLVTFQEGWRWVPGWRDYKINARCDDPKLACICQPRNGPTVAYSLQRLEKPPHVANRNAIINFCPAYFDYDTLDDRIEDAKGGLILPQEYANIDNYYQNQASAWIHELLHNFDVAKARDVPRDKGLFDWWVAIENVRGKAYGPWRAKGLARWGEFHLASLTHRNVDNIGLYILARYVQEKVLDNIYPHLPLAPKPAHEVLRREPIQFADLAVLYPDGTVVSLNAPPADPTCGEPDDDEEASPPDPLSLTYDGFITRDRYPPEYLALYDGWAA